MPGDAERVALAATRMTADLGAEPTLADVAVLAADPVIYTEADRPGAWGHLPTVSAAGSPTFLAQVTDPKDPLGSTRDEVMVRERHARAGEVLARAVDELRTRKTRHSAALEQPTRAVIEDRDRRQERLVGLRGDVVARHLTGLDAVARGGF